MDHAYFSNLSFSCPKEAPQKIEQHRPRGFKGGHLKLSTFFLYKCMGPIQMHTEANLTLPQKGQMSMYDHHLRNFGRPPVPDNLCKDSATRHPRFRRSRFLKVFTRMGMAATLVNGGQLV